MKIIYNLNEPNRIDKYISKLDIPDLYSRSLIEKLIKDGHIKVNDRPVKKNYQLKFSDNIEINIPEPQQLKAEAEKIPLDIVYEDEYFAVINKQAGVTVHPTPGNYSGTIVNAILYHFGDNLANAADDIRPGIVHRLDKDTSGLLIIAKNDKILHMFNKIFAERKINKYYKAITAGIPKEPEGVISLNIGRSSKDRTKMTVRKSGRHALTEYKTEKTYNYFSLVDIHLKTGRTHQIRVHFNYINCPILGDDSYGSNKLKNLIPLNIYKKASFYIQRHLQRQALHAYKLEFIHPVTEKEITLQTPLPADMQKCLQWLQTFLIESEVND